MSGPETPAIELPAGRPLLLLDIDGVINVLQCSEAREVRVAPYLPALKMLPGVEGWLRELDAAFYLVWCSAWGDLVNRDAAAAWGLPPRPALYPGAVEAARAGWKLRAVRQLVAGWPGALAWVENGFRDEARAWAAGRLAAGARTWLVDVSDTGLTGQVTADLLEWARTGT